MGPLYSTYCTSRFYILRTFSGNGVIYYYEKKILFWSAININPLNVAIKYKRFFLLNVYKIIMFLILFQYLFFCSLWHLGLRDMGSENIWRMILHINLLMVKTTCTHIIYSKKLVIFDYHLRPLLQCGTYLSNTKSYCHTFYVWSIKIITWAWSYILFKGIILFALQNLDSYQL